jgi:hypothetical protein
VADTRLGGVVVQPSLGYAGGTAEGFMAFAKRIMKLKAIPRRLISGVAWLFGSEYGSRVLTSIASLVAIVALPIAIAQLRDLPDQREMRAISILMMVDQQLGAENVRPIRHAILREESLDDFTSEELGDYLDILEGLASNHERGLVDIDSIDNWHGDVIIKTYRHPQVQQYIRDEQREDSDYYAGFASLAARLLRGSSRGHEPTFRRQPDVPRQETRRYQSVPDVAATR